MEFEMTAVSKLFGSPIPWENDWHRPFFEKSQNFRFVGTELSLLSLTIA
jgi:hypothetical protein